MPEVPGAVEIHRSRNKAFALYFVGLTIAGLVILGLGWTLRWGFWGWFGGGLLVFTGLASLASMAKTGGAGLARCPICGHAAEVLHVTEHRYLCCPGCQTWLEGATTMQVVADDHVADYPCFRVELPETFTWPPGCPRCGAPSTRSVALEGTDAIGDVFSLVAPISIQRVSKLAAPACDQHDDGVAIHREGSTVIIGFRSLAYWRRFMATNHIPPPSRPE